jgi:hypothetical protein
MKIAFIRKGKNTIRVVRREHNSKKNDGTGYKNGITPHLLQ